MITLRDVTLSDFKRHFVCFRGYVRIQLIEVQSKAGCKSSGRWWRHYSHSILNQSIYPVVLKVLVVLFVSVLFCEVNIICCCLPPANTQHLSFLTYRLLWITQSDLWWWTWTLQALLYSSHDPYFFYFMKMYSHCGVTLHFLPRCIDLSRLPNRSMEFSLYQETPHPQMQEVTPKEPSADPGTLVWSSRTHTYTLITLYEQKLCSLTHTFI